MSGLIARAEVGFSVFLMNDMTNNDFYRQEPEGITAFGDRAVLTSSSRAVVTHGVMIDSLLTTVVFYTYVEGKHIIQPSYMSYESYKQMKLRRDIRDLFRNDYAMNFQAAARAGGEGIAIDVPFRIKSKAFRRIFGGDNIGLRVSGNISIDGKFSQQKLGQTNAQTNRDESTAFHIDMTQRFSITGKVGEKVEVKVDQDSERLFDFENSIMLTYTGNENEIIKKIEAGNVSLNMSGPQRATISGKNKGLFGLKTEAQIGNLNLTGIASLERGQKNKLRPRQESRRQPFTEKDFIRDQYFWLNKDDTYEDGEAIELPNYRDWYRRYTQTREHQQPPGAAIRDIQIYVSVDPTSLPPDVTPLHGKAVAMKYLKVLEGEGGTITYDEIPAADRHDGYWRMLIKDTDYTINEFLGTVRFRQRRTEAQAIAFALVMNDNNNTKYGSYGFANDEEDPVDPDNLELIMLRPQSTDPNDDTWDLMFRHVYSLEGQGINPEDFKLEIIRKASSSQFEETGPPEDNENRTYLTVFGFDTQGESGGDPDGVIDDVPARMIDYAYGELHFLDLTPFNPSGYYLGDNIYEETRIIVDNGTDSTSQDFGSGYLNPDIYSETKEVLAGRAAKWNFIAEFTGVSTTYNLGVLVLEGSEEVYLNEELLQRGIGYTIDYLSGQLTIIDPRAKVAGADLDITYESGTVFQIDKKTLLGMRAEYGLWGTDQNKSYIGGMMLYLNEQTLDRRVRVGNEPMRNTLYDLNTVLNFKPNFLTAAVNKVPLVRTDTESTLKIEGEWAKVFPNPNALSNDATGDQDGLAFLDDFEGSRRATPLGMMRGNWSISSIPIDDNIDHRRGRFKWWNPLSEQQVEVQEVFPERETNDDVNERLQTLYMEFIPDDSPGSSVRRSWGGVMRYLGEGFANQSQTKFLEFWVEMPNNPEGRLVIDLGTISEDALPDGKMSSEDQPENGEDDSDDQREYGDGFLDSGEDTGIDEQNLPDPQDVAHWNGLDQDPIPSWDDYSYNPGSSDFDGVNGQEGNGGDRALEGNEDPDTEDLNRNKNLDTENSYFSYDLDFNYNNPFIVGGGENTGRWRLFRIPLDEEDNPDRRIVGEPSMTNIRWARLYMTGVSRRTRIRVVQMDLVSNEWLPEDEDNEDITITVINNHENPRYESPPGVQGEIDPITNLRQREQSLVLQLKQLDSPYFIAKNLFQDVNLIQYKRLKMFLHGGGINAVEASNPDFNEGLYEVVFRMGNDYGNIHDNYYEIIQTIKPGWAHPNNTIDVALNDLSLMNVKRDSVNTLHNDSLYSVRSAEEWDIDPDIWEETRRFAIATDTTQPGDSIAIKGRPSLQNVEFLAIGIRPILDEQGNPKNPMTTSEGIEVWADELRVTNIHKDPGTAVEMRADLKLADFISLNGTFSQIDADFHRVDERMTGSSLIGREDKLSYSGNINLNLHKFYLERWKVSIPVTMSYREDQGIPKFIPNTDARVDRDNAPDSIKSYSRSVSYTASFSKAGPTENPLVRWSLEKLRLSWNHSNESSKGFTRGRSKRKRTEVKANYSFPTATGRGIAPLWFLRPVPLLSLVGSPRIHFKPRQLDFGFTANQSDESTRNQAGQRTDRPSFTMTQNLSSAYDPFEPLTTSFTRSHSTVHRSDSLQKKGWKELFAGSLGELTSVSQSASANYSPQFTSWFSPGFSYGSSYNWSNRNLEDETNQDISNSRTLGTDVTLDFGSIFGESSRGGRGSRGSRQSQPDEEETSEGGEDSTQTQTRTAPRITLAKSFSTVMYPIKKALGVLDPVSLSYDKTINHSDGARLGQATAAYQFGFTQDPGNERVEGTTRIPSLSKTDTYTGRSGIRFSRDISSTLDYSWRQSDNEQTNLRRTTDQTMFWLGTDSDPPIFPFLDYGITWSGLERIAFLGKATETITLRHGLSSSMSEEKTSDTDSAGVRSFDLQRRVFTRDFRPLLGVDVTWKGGIGTSISFGQNDSFKDEVITNQRSTSTSTDASLTVSYMLNTGFRLPLLWMSAIRLQNRTTFSLTFDYNTRHSQRTQTTGDPNSFVDTEKSTGYTLQPSIEYSFSDTVTGRSWVMLSQTKDGTNDQTTRLFEFGINVNIAIRG